MPILQESSISSIEEQDLSFRVILYYKSYSSVSLIDNKSE